MSAQQQQCRLFSIFSNQPITAPYFPNQPITIHFLVLFDWPIQISSTLIGQHPKENIRPRPREHPVFTHIGQSKIAFAFHSTNHYQTETTVAKSTASNNPTSPSPIHPALRTTSASSPPPPPLTSPPTGAPDDHQRRGRGEGATKPSSRPRPFADRSRRSSTTALLVELFGAVDLATVVSVWR